MTDHENAKQSQDDIDFGANTDQEHTSKSDRRMPERTFLANEYIFKEGETARLCYQIVSGSVGIYKQLNGHQEEIIEFKEGEIFGEMALIDHSLRRASAIAKETTVVKQIHERAFMDYLAQSPESSMSIMERLLSYARTSMDSNEVDVITLAERSLGITPTKDSQKSSISISPLSKQHGSSSNALTQKVELPNITNDAIGKSKEINSQGHVTNYQISTIATEARQTLILVLLLITSLALALSTTNVHKSIPVEGQLISSVEPIEIKAAEPAMIKSIYANIGNTIAKGEIIADLSLLRKSNAANKEQQSGSKQPSESNISYDWQNELMAPTAGYIVAAPALMEGRTILEGEHILTIQPTNTPLLATFSLSSTLAKTILQGSYVELYLDAPAHNKHGSLHAKIIQIDESKSSKDADIKAIIVSHSLTNLPDDFTLMPGTYVSGKIIRGSESTLSHLLTPMSRLL